MNANITNGQNGFIKITSSAPAVGVKVSVLKAIGAPGDDVVFDTVAGCAGASDLGSETLAVGDFITGHFTDISVTSGTLLGYLA